MPTRNRFWSTSVAAIAAAGMATGAVAAGSMSGGELGATGQAEVRMDEGQTGIKTDQEGHVEASENPDASESDTLQSDAEAKPDVDYQADVTAGDAKTEKRGNPDATESDYMNE